MRATNGSRKKKGVKAMALPKIYDMHRRFGTSGDKEAICRDCSHLCREDFPSGKSVRKCSVYGITSSAATDWRIGWTACGYYNKDYPGIPVIESRKKAGNSGGQIAGQLSLFKNR